ncbi:MAG: tail fiber domain-containing protein [Sphingobacteriaceae bacterium]
MFKKYIILKVSTLLFLALFCQLSYAQNVGINSTGAAPHASAMLDVASTATPFKGFLAPRMTAAQRAAISSPATGLMVYQTDAPAGFYYFNGTIWVIFNSGAISGWSTTGNNSTTPGTHFIGTNDAKDFVFKTSGSERARILSDGNFGIGTPTPTQLLDVKGNAIFGLGTTGKVKISNTDDAGNNSSDIYIEEDKMLRLSNSGLGQTGSSLQLKNSTENYLFSFEGRGGFRYYSRTTGNMGEKMRVNDEGDIYLTTKGENTAVDGQGDINDFYQLNVMNQNSGSNASSDVVATADNGDDTDAYIDMGINSSGYNNSTNGTSTILNGPNTTYLYGNGENMFVGNASRNKHLIFFTNSSSQDGGEDARGTERMRITSTGALGFGASASTGTSGYVLTSSGPTGPPTWTAVGSSSNWSLDGNTVTAMKTIGTKDNFALPFVTNNLERMRLHANGNLGIGSSDNDHATDEAKIEITANAEQYTGLSLIGDSEEYFELNVQNTGNDNGGDSSTDIVATANNGSEDNNYINMGINSQNYRAFQFGDSRILNGPNKAYIYSTGREFYIGNSSEDYPLVFFTNASQDGDVDARGRERMRIMGTTGNVIIGYDDDNQWPSDYTDQGSQYKLQINGTIRWTNYSQSSDRALKTNIQPLTYGLKDVLSLKPVKYNWIDPTKSTEKQIGLIAQDVRETIPEIVSGDESKKGLGIEYTGLIPVLINAIKEQQAQIEELKQQVQKLQK